MNDWYIEHSAKGSTWKKHKYIRKDGNRYVYAPGVIATKNRMKRNMDRYKKHGQKGIDAYNAGNMEEAYRQTRAANLAMSKVKAEDAEYLNEATKTLMKENAKLAVSQKISSFRSSAGSLINKGRKKVGSILGNLFKK